MESTKTMVFTNVPFDLEKAQRVFKNFLRQITRPQGMSARDIHIANVVRHWGAQEPWSLFPENVRPNGYVGKSAWAYLDKIARECSIKQGVDLVVKECSKAGLHEYNLKQAAGTLREGERPKVERVSHKYVAGAAFNLSNGDIVGDKTGSVFGGVQRSVARSKKSTKAARKRVKDESNDDEDEDMSDDTTDTEPLFGGKRPSKSKSAIGRSLGVRAGCLRKVATKMAPSFSGLPATSATAQKRERSHSPDGLTAQLLREKRARIDGESGRDIVTLGDSDDGVNPFLAKQHFQVGNNDSEGGVKTAVKTEDTSDAEGTNGNNLAVPAVDNTKKVTFGGLKGLGEVDKSGGGPAKEPVKKTPKAGGKNGAARVGTSTTKRTKKTTAASSKVNQGSSNNSPQLGTSINNRASPSGQRNTTFLSLENFSEEHTRIIIDLAESLAKGSASATVTVANTRPAAAENVSGPVAEH